MDSIHGHFGAGNHMDFVNKLVNGAENGVLVIADSDSIRFQRSFIKVIG
jgi:hypothetical protein